MSSPAQAAAPLALEQGGNGPPLILVHGLGLSRRCWRPVREQLEQHHDVVAVDLPGFGESPPLPDGDTPTPTRLADILEHEIGRLGLVAPTVVGNSLGGWVALDLARRGCASCAVAIAPSGLETPPERMYVIALNELMRTRARLSLPFARQLTASLISRTVLFGGLRSRPWRVPPQTGERDLQEFGCSPGFQAALRASVGTRIPAGLGEIDVPVCIVYGTLDLMLGALTAPRFAAAIPGAELVPLPGLGHVPMLDDPALVARTILDFTNRYAPTAAWAADHESPPHD
jgi:pimeloyl-ACP methyl ester carboxylesterase